MSVLDNLKQALELLQQNEDAYNELFNQQSETDRKVDFWLHYIELNNVPVTQSYKIIREIKRLREKRRTIKNELEIMKVFRDNEQKLVNAKNRQILLINVCKTDNKQQNAKYSYDAYTDNEMNEILGIKNEKIDRQLGRIEKENDKCN